MSEFNVTHATARSAGLVGLYSIMRRSVTRFGFLVGSVLCWTAMPVWACPTCATNTQNSGGFFYLLAAMLLLPYPIVATVIYIIRKVDSADQTLEQRLRPTEG